MKRLIFALAGALLATAASAADVEIIGEVSTEFKLFGPDHKIMVEAIDDHDVPGVACHISRAKTGGAAALVGLATDTSDVSIACRQVGPISVKIASLKNGVEIFKQSSSPIFKHMRVVRFVDVKRNTLVYLVYSDLLVNGSPKNSISTVPIMPWPVAGLEPAKLQ